MEVIFLLAIIIGGIISKEFFFNQKRIHRRDYYRNDYLQSDAWQRKRYVVLKRDNWRSVYCGAKAGNKLEYAIAAQELAAYFVANNISYWPSKTSAMILMLVCSSSTTRIRMMGSEA